MNKDSIDAYFKTSKINISSVDEICDNIYLVEGTFRGKLMYPTNNINTAKPKEIELTDGEFRFIKRQ